MSTSEAGEEGYEVEEIRDKRKVVGGGWLYHVKWVGWASDSNTWEPPEHLEPCKGLVEEFERKLVRKAERREVRKREEREKREKKKRRRREREIANANKLKACTSESEEEVDRRVDKDINHNEEDVVNKNPVKYNEEVKKNDVERKKLKKANDLDLFGSDYSSHAGEQKNEPSITKGEYFQDQIPSRIIGVTRDPPLTELYFFVEFENKDEKEGSTSTGLITAKEAYQKIPLMCLQYYENHLVWGKNK
eukprot:GFUD01037121.1.p1 GENE.GFUD01037121.1~~GFUD01037121.1.p1  ORF type:complete len:248 (-),score=74.41 GFUD01037121.1:135-878(-)